MKSADFWSQINQALKSLEIRHWSWRIADIWSQRCWKITQIVWYIRSWKSPVFSFWGLSRNPVCCSLLDFWKFCQLYVYSTISLVGVLMLLCELALFILTASYTHTHWFNGIFSRISQDILDWFLQSFYHMEALWFNGHFTGNFG